jgi:hypothetical protein
MWLYICLQLILHVCNVVIILTYASFAWQTWRAYRLSEKAETQRVFFYLSIVFLLCAFTGYFMHIARWIFNFELFFEALEHKSLFSLFLNTGAHIGLAIASTLLVKSTALSKLINSVNDIKERNYQRFKELHDE